MVDTDCILQNLEALQVLLRGQQHHHEGIKKGILDSTHTITHEPTFLFAVYDVISCKILFGVKT